VSKASNPTHPEEHKQTMREKISAMSFAQVGLFVLAAGYTVYFIKPVLMPIILALLLTLILKPVQRRLQKYLRLPAPAAALLVMLVAAAISFLSVLSLTQPVLNYAEEMKGPKVKERLAKMFKPVSQAKQDITEVAEEMQKMTNSSDANEEKESDQDLEGKGTEREEGQIDVSVESQLKDGEKSTQVDVTTDSGDVSVNSTEGNTVDVQSEEPPVKVQITNNDDPAKPLYTFASNFAMDFLATLALLFFFLAYGDTMIKRMAEVDGAESLLKDLTRDVSYYLFSISAINIGLGTAIGLGMWFLGMPNPILWGVMAAIFNFISILGALVGAVIVFIVATITFENTSQVIPVPLVYYALTAIEGNFITPAILGKRFTINPLIVFVWIFCWGIMWGIMGMLFGLPLLMVFRIICAKLPSLSRVERVISI